MNYAKQLLQEQKETLREDLAEQYISEYGNEDTKDVVDLIQNLDIDCINFNAGFEQGYMFALQAVIMREKADEDYAMLARENENMAKALKRLNYTQAEISDICNGAI